LRCGLAIAIAVLLPVAATSGGAFLDPNAASSAAPVVAGSESPSKVTQPEQTAEAASATTSPVRKRGFPVPAKTLRYAERLVHQYDSNGDGSLQKEEWQKVHGNPQQVDANRDGVITVDEFAQYIARYGQLHRIHLFQPAAEVNLPPSLFRPSSSVPSSEALASGEEKAEPEPVSIDSAPQMPTPAAAEDASDRVVRRAPRANHKFHVSRASLPAGLPEWFTTRDADGDGQITMAEFAPSPSRSDIQEFNRYDRNRDGVITARELIGSAKPAAKSAADRPAR
jgi:Ca2+-binding EF-hand superfamily protein